MGVSEVGTTEEEEGITKTHPEEERQLLAVKVFLTPRVQREKDDEKEKEA